MTTPETINTAKSTDKAAYIKTALSPLTTGDRCDQCGAQAYGQAFFAGIETPLMFCKHHLDAHLKALRAQAIRVHDYTGALTKGSS